MASPCNNINIVPIKVSQLVRYKNIDVTDYFLTIESGSALYSRKSTFGDLMNSIADVTGSYTGSFTGSLHGSGSYYGSVVSKNTKATGSFKGNLTGDVIGTSSYSITSSNSNTSSYLLQTTQNTTNQLGYFNGTRLISTPGLIFTNNTGGQKSLNISSSLSFNTLVIASRGYTSAGTQYNSAAITLRNYNDSNSYPNVDGWTITSAGSGSLAFIAPIGSNAFSSSTVLAKSTSNECYGLIQRRNGFYFWPYMSTNTPARDGAIGIGVQPPNESTGSFNKYLRAKLQINMFSGSGEGRWGSPEATVENRSTAILINYGSGSVQYKTFHVSASGNTYIKGKLNVDAGITGSFQGVGFKNLNGKSVSFWGTSSHAVSASYAKTADSIAGGGLSGLGISYTSTNTLASFLIGANEGGVGTYCYAVSHGFGSTPSIIKATLICTSNDDSWSVNDEIDVSACWQDTGSGDEEIPIFTTWSNATYASLSVGQYYFGGAATVYVFKKTAGTRTVLDANKWKIKIRAWQ